MPFTHLRTKALVEKPGNHSYGDTCRLATFTAAEAGTSTLHCMSFPDTVSVSVKEAFYQEAVCGSCLDDEVFFLVVHFGSGFVLLCTR